MGNLLNEKDTIQKDDPWNVMVVDTRGWRFDREEINDR